MAKALERIEQQRTDLNGAVTYGARRILAFALMIHDGMTPTALDTYLAERAWARDAAAHLDQGVGEFVRSQINAMLASGALTLTGGVVRAAQPAEPVDPHVFDLPFPSHWPHPSCHPKTARPGLAASDRDDKPI